MSIYNNINFLDWSHGVVDGDLRECIFRTMTFDEQSNRLYFTVTIRRKYIHNYSHLPDESCYSVSLWVHSGISGSQELPFPISGSRLWYFFTNKAKTAFAKQDSNSK